MRKMAPEVQEDFLQLARGFDNPVAWYEEAHIPLLSQKLLDVLEYIECIAQFEKQIT